MKRILALVLFVALVASASAQTPATNLQGLSISSNGVLYHPTNFWTANASNIAPALAGNPLQFLILDASKTNGSVSYQLTTNDCAKFFDNLGTIPGTATNIYTLPNPTIRGWFANFTLSTNGVLLIVATNSASILTPNHASAANGALYTSQLYATAHIVCADGTNFLAVTNGAWTAP